MFSMINRPLRKSLGVAKWRLTEIYKKLSYRLTVPWSKDFVRNFWNDQAEMIHDRYGHLDHDHQVLCHLFETYQPGSILDVGCGSGRLFGIYAQYGIQDVVGIDISDRALVLANQRFPGVPTICKSIEDLEFPSHRFDMAICNRVLQHVPPLHVSAAVEKLCSWCNIIYINELSNTDDLNENFYMMCHDYVSLFSKQNFTMLDHGTLGLQTYQVYGRT